MLTKCKKSLKIVQRIERLIYMSTVKHHKDNKPVKDALKNDFKKLSDIKLHARFLYLGRF